MVPQLLSRLGHPTSAKRGCGTSPDCSCVAGKELQKETGTRSYMSCLFWLSDDVEGGETVFTYPQGGIWVAIPPKILGAQQYLRVAGIRLRSAERPQHQGSGKSQKGICLQAEFPFCLSQSIQALILRWAAEAKDWCSTAVLPWAECGEQSFALWW